MSDAISSMYLSGWEYNRLLDDHDPTTPRNSALPASVLWNGSAILWMFEEVFCTKEALDNELYAYRELNWTTGKVFGDLRDDGILKPLDWSRDLDPSTVERMKARHAELQNDYPANMLRSAIVTYDGEVLNACKTQLLAPILLEKHCANLEPPSSLGNWIDGKPTLPKISDSADQDDNAVRAGLTALKQCDERRIPTTVDKGRTLCRSPKTVLSDVEMAAQRTVERDVQTPLIPALMAGDQPFDGARGYEAYIQANVPHKRAFVPANELIVCDWEKERSNLMRLRRAAAEHLWPELHHTKLPRLQAEGQQYLPEFLAWIHGALARAPLAGLLNMKSGTVASIGFVIGTVVQHLIKSVWGLPSFDLASGVATAALLEELHRWQRTRYGQLALFLRDVGKGGQA